jgi:hypothetical protein
MVFRRRVVSEEVPVVTPVIEHTTVERDDGVSVAAVMGVILAGAVLIALVWFFAWYEPQQLSVTQPATNTTVIEHQGTATQPMVNVPPPVVVNPPAQSRTTIVNPPANNTTIVNPPDTSSSNNTDNGTVSDENSTTTGQ